MKNTLLSKGYRYFVRLSGSGVPVLGSLVARRVAPRRSNTTWTDITSCLTGCCGITLTAVDTTVTINDESGDLTTLAGLVSSSGDTLTFTAIDTNGGDFTVDVDGNYIVSATMTGTVVVVVTDTHGNSVTITITIDVTVE